MRFFLTFLPCLILLGAAVYCIIWVNRFWVGVFLIFCAGCWTPEVRHRINPKSTNERED